MDSGISLGCMRGDLDTLDPIHILVLVLKGNHADQNVRKKSSHAKVQNKYNVHAIGKYRIKCIGGRAYKVRGGKFRKSIT